MSFGLYGTFPFTFGGEESSQEIASQALKTALSPEPGLGYDVTDAMMVAEIDADANAIATIWDVNERLTNSALPTRMMEALPEAEQVYGIRPTPEQSDAERRANVAAKARALPDNTLTSIESAVRALAGDQFVSMNLPSESQVFVFWPLVNPGPPGFEWTSSRNHIQISLTKAGLPDDASYERLRAATINLLDAMVPSTHTFSVNTGSGFILAESLLGLGGF